MISAPPSKEWRYQKSNFDSILPQAQAQNQGFLDLFNYINNRQLTDTLEFLDQSGYSGNTALFLIANFQSLMGVGR
jgi:hypothetical protein